ncbi:MAG TPA: YhcH/YjgK/YiaL family protein [Anaeromyxobacter sp.]|nr:YhcH/YjgK/YiaL family protein [Anaeromyxobacter sp.]
MAMVGSVGTVRALSPPGVAFARAFAYVEKLFTKGSEEQRRLLTMVPGAVSRIELGNGVHVMEHAYWTRGRAGGRWESHVRYADLQVLVSGEELVELAEVAQLEAEEDLRPEKDVILYGPPPASRVLRLAVGDAALLFPADAHLTGLATAERCIVHKAVIKVPVGG